ncbi:uncharacterized protein FIBRA_05598 [Fibroporia radiculosa]|uniref:Uncharacterized protein n=1 Tax=Fibroporia radiculosa TaxID=599839 RepID=J4GRB0_9APHY|nr:uncharacterized protein FIBRA_05598 [Fibroporia radiculosa]CCM03465.1 predicted protein [Fibroporia radiculosa]
MSTASVWPSLYNWVIELFPIGGKAPVQPGGYYLYDRNEIFRFTLYWTLVFYGPAYIICATYAFFNVTFPPSRPSPEHLKRRPSFPVPFSSSYFGAPPMVAVNDIPMTPYSPIPPEADAETTAALAHRYRALLKPNEKRSRVTFALLVFLAFAVFSVAGAVIGSAVIGYVLAGLFKAGDFNMSTSMDPVSRRGSADFGRTPWFMAFCG